jgi:hypothetical protein
LPAALLLLSAAPAAAAETQSFACRAAASQFEQIDLPETVDPTRLVLRVTLEEPPPNRTWAHLSISFRTRGESSFGARIEADREWPGLYHVSVYRPFRSRRFMRASMDSPREITLTLDERSRFAVATDGESARTRISGWNGKASLHCGSSAWRVEILEPASSAP